MKPHKKEKWISSKEAGVYDPDAMKKKPHIIHNLPHKKVWEWFYERGLWPVVMVTRKELEKMYPRRSPRKPKRVKK